MIAFCDSSEVATMMLLRFLAQIDPEIFNQEGRPILRNDSMGTSGMTWVIAAVLTAGILLIAFKTSKRNHLERE
jgi:hypothetical protein